MKPSDTIVIDGRAYSWRALCERRRQQLEAWKAAQPRQPALFELKDDSRPDHPARFLLSCSYWIVDSRKARYTS